MTSDVRSVRYRQARGRGSVVWEHVRNRRRASHHRARAAGPVAHDRRLVTLDAYAGSAISTSSVPTWLELDVWLTRLLFRYAAWNRAMENTVPRDNR
jgi:hypothetical protein